MLKKDIVFLLSGGASNVNLQRSLGGLISNQIIDDQINNLFNDITPEQSFNGHTDYRCFYIFNKSKNENLKNFSIYIHKNLQGSEISIGLSLRSEVQALIVNGNPPTSAHFQLTYVLRHQDITHIATTRQINWVPDEKQMAQRIAAILNSLDHLQGITCVGNKSENGYDFLITFGGPSSGRKQEILAISNEVSISAQVIQVTQGGPINSVAPNIGISNNPPNDVTFFDTDNLTPILIGTFFSLDYIPIWIKRQIDKNTTPIHPDQFRFHLFGEPVPILLKSHKPDIKITETTIKSKKMHF